MAMTIKLLTIYISLIMFVIILPTESMVTSRDLNWWCNQTMYNEQCKHHMMSHSPVGANSSSIISRSQFLDVAIRVAMNHALDALNHIKRADRLHPKGQSSREIAAWTNCVKLYDNTIYQLKKTMFFSNRSTPFDIQTWLSAALTNLRTCQTGINHELNIAAYSTSLHFMSNNLTRLIENTLAINSVLSSTKERQHVSPSWYSRKDGETCLRAQCANVVVAKDGSGNFCTIAEALDASVHNRPSGCERFVIHLKEGVYNEYLEITESMTNITMIGDGESATIITGSRSAANGYWTYDSATVKVCGDGFIAHGITFENAAGPNAGQAVALLSSSDRSAFYRCGFRGYQDTLCVMAQRQFYQQCHIYGTVDFIFGNAAAVLQNCYIYVRKPMPGGGLVITAQGRENPYENTGIVIENSIVKAAEDLKPVLGQYKVYLGRPWMPYSRVVYIECFLDDFVDAEGWMKWDNDPTRLSTLYFGEYANSGPGSATQGRVTWPGYKKITDKSTVDYFTVDNFIGGQSWLPATGVPFFSGLKG